MSTAPHEALLQQAQKLADQYSHDKLLNIFLNPVIILSAPRSGSTLLFETLKCADHFWSIGSESHIIFNAFPELHASSKKFNSGVLNAKDANPELCHLMRAFFLLLLVDNKGQHYLNLPENERPASITLLEKTPRNALNTPFLNILFPGMKVIFLYRDPCENISSIIEAWEVGLQSGRFVTFQNLPGWDRGNWCLLLPPAWRKLKGKSIAEIAAFQWVAANKTILSDLEKLNTITWCLCDYRNLIDDTERTVTSIAAFAGVEYEGSLRARACKSLPPSKTIITAPKRDKWKRHSEVLKPLANKYTPMLEKLKQLTSTHSTNIQQKNN